MMYGKMKPMKKKNGSKKVMGKRKKLDMDKDGKLCLLYTSDAADE